MLIDESVRSFLDGLSTDEPVPGGGAASAMAGAMGSALFGMAVAVTRSKEAEKDEELRSAANRLQILGARISLLVDLDASAYAKVREAYRLPRETEDQRVERARRIQEACIEATLVPLETAERCLEVLETADDVARLSRASCLCDAGVGNFLTLAAIMGSLMNVTVNCQQIDSDPEFVANATARANAVAVRTQEQFERVRETVTGRLAEP